MATENIDTQMRKGMLEYGVLLTLRHGRAYPSDIMARLKDAGLTIVEGTLYTLLNRLKREEALTYHWEESPKGPPRKYYELTEKGMALLQLMGNAWCNLATSIETLRHDQPMLPANNRK